MLPLGGLYVKQVKVKVTLQLTVSQSLCQGIEPILGLVTRYYFLSRRKHFANSSSIVATPHHC
jgi:hypothetical protein